MGLTILLVVPFLAVLFGMGMAAGYLRIARWILPAVLGLGAVGLSVWIWADATASSCSGCEYEGLAEAIALFVTIGLGFAWMFGSAALTAGAAWGRRLRHGDHATAPFT